MLVGYARDSSAGQPLDIQLRALSDAGCAKVFPEKKRGMPGSAGDALENALKFVLEGDTFVVAGLDCLPRSAIELDEIIAGLTGRGVKFRCLQQSRVERGLSGAGRDRAVRGLA